eukprot:Hpha_TRINITY_DN23770_c0_g1::TRINITY_DN23770_c0_g1_i1::g.93263::m.93263
MAMLRYLLLLLPAVYADPEGPAHQAPLEFFDPHFHQWNCTAAACPSGHDGKSISGVFVRADLETALAPLSELGLTWVGGVWLEAMSVCFVNTSGELLAKHYTQELAWAQAELTEETNRTFLFVPGASLEADNANTVLGALAEDPAVRGVRQILNFDPSWPRNAALGDLLDNPAWRAGYASLARYNLSFDMQLNPAQFKKAAALIAQHPEVPVIINHIGTVTLDTLQDPQLAAKYW